MYKSKNSWQNVQAEYIAELYEHEGNIYESNTDKLIPQISLEMVPNIERGESYELVVEFESSGYYDAGVSYGLPENCYPPESDEERTLHAVHIVWNPDADTKECVQKLRNGKVIKLEKSLQDDIFELLRDEIEEVEIILGDEI